MSLCSSCLLLSQSALSQTRLSQLRPGPAVRGCRVRTWEGVTCYQLTTSQPASTALARPQQQHFHSNIQCFLSASLYSWPEMWMMWMVWLGGEEDIECDTSGAGHWWHPSHDTSQLIISMPSGPHSTLPGSGYVTLHCHMSVQESEMMSRKYRPFEIVSFFICLNQNRDFMGFRHSGQSHEMYSLAWIAML